MRNYYIISIIANEKDGEVKNSELYTGIEQKYVGIYQGKVKNSLPHGAGNIKYENGDEYFGELINGIIQGNGILIESGNKYKGNFIEGKKHGLGKMIYSNNDIYDGEWSNDRKWGLGKYIWANGDIYEGEWLSDERNGEGKMILQNGDIIPGVWWDNKWQQPGSSDPLLIEAAKLVVRHQQGSTSLIQRKFSIGYNRASNIVDQLEAKGVIGPFEGRGTRQVLFSDEIELNRLFDKLK